MIHREESQRSSSVQKRTKASRSSKRSPRLRSVACGSCRCTFTVTMSSLHLISRHVCRVLAGAQVRALWPSSLLTARHQQGASSLGTVLCCRIGVLQRSSTAELCKDIRASMAMRKTESKFWFSLAYKRPAQPHRTQI